MNIKVRTEISDDFKDVEVIINTNKLNPDVKKIIELLQNLDTSIDKIIASQNDNIFIINLEDVVCFYSEQKSNYCRTNRGVFKVKETLYELEEKLSANDFIRISNSCIININHIECFNTGSVGTIMVKFKDGKVEYVSRRRVSQVMKKLKGGS